MLKDEYAGLNDIRLPYMSAGKGKLIMFAYGFPEFWYEWRNQLAELGRDYQAVAPVANLPSSKFVSVCCEGLLDDVNIAKKHIGG